MWNNFENMPKRKAMRKQKNTIKENTYKALINKPGVNIGKGSVYSVSNKTWNIPINMYFGKRHPGVVLKQNRYHRVIACKGTDLKNVLLEWNKAYTIIKPDDQNGLIKETAFFNTPKEISTVALESEKYAGTICDKDYTILMNNCRTFQNIMK
ncbi:MAG: hypothetical protein HQK75_10660 [Candidatus Magnetomorum sp.]|nr:hypothetical protein [Candidatus Magnetomorum sp.]